MSDLTHLDEQGQARMVEGGGKEATRRVAVARGEVSMRPENPGIDSGRESSQRGGFWYGQDSRNYGS